MTSTFNFTGQGQLMHMSLKKLQKGQKALQLTVWWKQACLQQSYYNYDEFISEHYALAMMVYIIVKPATLQHYL